MAFSLNADGPSIEVLLRREGVRVGEVGMGLGPLRSVVSRLLYCACL